MKQEGAGGRGGFRGGELPQHESTRQRPQPRKRRVWVMALCGLAAAVLAAVLATSEPGGLRDGLRAYRAGRYEQALLDFQRGVRESGGDCVDCRLGVARSSLKLGRMEAVTEACEAVLRESIDPRQRAEAYSLEGLVELGRGGTTPDAASLRQAEGKFRQAVEADGQIARIRVDLAGVLQREGCMGEARRQLRAALEIGPENGVAVKIRRKLSDLNSGAVALRRQTMPGCHPSQGNLPAGSGHD